MNDFIICGFVLIIFIQISILILLTKEEIFAGEIFCLALVTAFLTTVWFFFASYLWENIENKNKIEVICYDKYNLGYDSYCKINSGDKNDRK